MEIVLANTAGFCFGVKRAVEVVYEEINKNSGKIYTYGPIIHNENVVADLKEKGVEVISEGEDLSGLEKGTVIIRSHGVSKDVENQLKNSGFNIVDASCPFVKKIHRIVEKDSLENRFIIVVGDSAHPEVQGIVGWINGNDYQIISTREEAEAFCLDKSRKITAVGQTTCDHKKFKELVEIISQKGYDINVLDTICNATFERQNEAREIAARVDAMIVIGGLSSSNTQKLYDICRKECKNTYYIQTVDDLDLSLLKSIRRVGITAGASTPNYIIEEVQTKCQN